MNWRTHLPRFVVVCQPASQCHRRVYTAHTHIQNTEREHMSTTGRHTLTTSRIQVERTVFCLVRCGHCLQALLTILPEPCCDTIYNVNVFVRIPYVGRVSMRGHNVYMYIFTAPCDHRHHFGQVLLSRWSF